MDFLLYGEFLNKPGWMWLGFLVFVTILLVIDLGVLHRRDREIDISESLRLAGFYILISLLFGFVVWHLLGQERAFEYYTGYVIELSLSIDNLFVMALIFSALNIPRIYQHRVLFWGIIGVIVMRGLMIGLGSALVMHFEWVLYLFAAFLIFTGVKLLFIKDDDLDNHKIENNPIIKFLRRYFRITDKFDGHKFIVKAPEPKSGHMVLYVTPLLVALITIEIADVIFAVDSVPAIFTITTDPYIIYTSNIFAILGLRSLYFTLSAMMERFAYLKYSLAMVLIFIGAKVFVAEILGLEKIPAEISLGVTLGLLSVGVFYSLYKTQNGKKN